MLDVPPFHDETAREILTHLSWLQKWLMLKRLRVEFEDEVQMCSKYISRVWGKNPQRMMFWDMFRAWGWNPTSWKMSKADRWRTQMLT